MKLLKHHTILFALAMATLLSCSKRCLEDPSNTLYNNGCGDFMVYDNYNVPSYDFSYISVSINKEELNLTQNYKTFELANNPNITSRIDAFNKDYNPFCTDVLLSDFITLHSWELQSGQADIKMVRDKNDCDSRYVVDVRLRNVIYKDSSNNELLVANKHFKNVMVGWYPG